MPIAHRSAGRGYSPVTDLLLRAYRKTVYRSAVPCAALRSVDRRSGMRLKARICWRSAGRGGAGLRVCWRSAGRGGAGLECTSARQLMFPGGEFAVQHCDHLVVAAIVSSPVEPANPQAAEALLTGSARHAVMSAVRVQPMPPDTHIPEVHIHPGARAGVTKHFVLKLIFLLSV